MKRFKMKKEELVNLWLEMDAEQIKLVCTTYRLPIAEEQHINVATLFQHLEKFEKGIDRIGENTPERNDT